MKQVRGGKLRASTLAETLVMMLVAGIVLLAAMDGLTLFMRLQTRRAAALVEAGRQREGFYRIERLTAAADSIAAEGDTPALYGSAALTLWRGGRAARLVVQDSALIYSAGEFRDTLLRGAGRMRLARDGTAADTLEIGVEGRTLKLPIRRPARRSYEMRIEQIEETYGYEAP